MSVVRDDSTLIEVAKLYYRESMAQDAIARLLGVSRSNVSRMLTAAKDRGIVEIHIHEALARDRDLERALVGQFGLREAVVASREAPAGAPPAQPLGEAAWDWLRHHARGEARLAISWGETLQAVAAAITPLSLGSSRPGVEVLQLVGGAAATATSTTAQELARDLAQRLGGSYRYLHAPAAFTTAAACRAMLGEPSIAQALEAARSADLALVGIGAVFTGSSATMLAEVGLSGPEREEFDAAGPVGDIAGRYFDGSGRAITGVVEERILGLTLAEIRALPTVLAVAAGPTKVAGVLGALHGQLVDVLVTDAGTAAEVLARA